MLWLIIGLLSLLGLIFWVPLGSLAAAMPGRKKTPREVIAEVLGSKGMSDQTIRYWTAVSQLETANWTSKVFQDSNNLFALIVPGQPGLKYGEGQTIFPSWADSAEALYTKVIKPFKYALNYDSPDKLVHDMKSHYYFGGKEDDYLAGVKMYLKQNQ